MAPLGIVLDRAAWTEPSLSLDPKMSSMLSSALRNLPVSSAWAAGACEYLQLSLVGPELLVEVLGLGGRLGSESAPFSPLKG